MSQSEMADLLGMTRQKYSKIELGAIDCETIVCDEVSNLTLGEITCILRMRNKATQKECAKELGISRYWFNRLEIGEASDNKLRKFWGIE